MQTYSDCRIVSHKINAARFRQSPQPKKRDFEAAATKKFVPQQIFHYDLWACAEKKHADNVFLRTEFFNVSLHSGLDREIMGEMDFPKNGEVLKLLFLEKSCCK